MLNSFLLTNSELDVIDVNIAFCEMTGYSREDLLKMNVSQFDAGLTFDEIKMNLQTALQSGAAQFETKNKRKDGTVVDVEVSLAKMEIDGKCYFASFGRDITNRKEAERKLRESEKQLSSAAQIAKLAYWEYDVGSRLFTFNDQFYDIFKATAEIAGGYKMSAKRYEEFFIYPEDKDLVREETVKAIKSSDPEYNYRFEYRVIYQGSNIGHVAVHYFISKDINGKTIKVFGTIQDVTEQKKAAVAVHELQQEILKRKVQEQKQITRAIISAQEKERNRIGQELHDNVCQILTGAKLYLDRKGKKDEKIRQLLEYPLELIISSISEIRSLSSENVTPLKDIGLKDLIQSLISNFFQTTSVKTDFSYSLEFDYLDDDLKLNIYRIIQEQLTNIGKHAEPTNVTISLFTDQNVVRLSIKDDGEGFDPDQKRNGIGISNIINRVECFNGKISIESFPGAGCTMKIGIPL